MTFHIRRRKSSMLPTIIAYLLIGCFLVLQRAMRQGEQAKNLRPEQYDRGSTRLIGQAFFVAILALIVAPILNAFQIGRLDKDIVIGWSGITLMLIGLGLRIWANQTLGRFYTSTLRIAERQRIIRRGAYKLLRHPGYSGALLTWAGAGAATANWIVIAIIVLVMVASYRYRIISEETMLQAKFGEEYQAYMARTWRLLPFIY